MLVSRWQAPYVPTEAQFKILLELEGLEPNEELFPVQARLREHKHPFSEVRVVVDGELLVNISGNQILLRSGDKIEIPANTRHSYNVQGGVECKTICAFRYF